MSSHLTVWSTWWMIVYTEFQLCRMYGFLIIHLAFLVHVKPSPTASEADEELLTEGDLERERESGKCSSVGQSGRHVHSLF